MVRSGKLSKSLIQVGAVVVTLWFSSHMFYVMDRSYRHTLRQDHRVFNFKGDEFEYF